jgi:hypothetical protein
MLQFTEQYLDKKVCPGVSILETILSPTKKSSLDQPHHVIPHALHSINLIRITFFSKLCFNQRFISIHN